MAYGILYVGCTDSLMNDISKQKFNFITGGKELCSDCERFLTEKEQPNHNNGQCQSGNYLTVPSLLPLFRPRTQYDLNILKRFIPRDMHPLLTANSVGTLLTQMQRAKQQIIASNIKLESADPVSKCFFGTRDYWDRCNKGVLFLLLKFLPQRHSWRRWAQSWKTTTNVLVMETLILMIKDFKRKCLSNSTGLHFYAATHLSRKSCLSTDKK